MIIGIGTDIIEVDRIKKACENESFKRRYFTDKEIQYFDKRKNNRYLSMAGNFAGKEAISKCLGTGFSGFLPIDIEILRDEKGKPYVVMHNLALEIANKLEINKMHISIAHIKDVAVAYAIAEK